MARIPEPVVNDNFERLERALSRSVGARALQWLAGVVSVAFRASALNAATSRIRQSAQGLPPKLRVRLVGCGLLAFVVVHSALLAIVPDNVAPAMPLAVWLAVALFAALLIAAPHGLVRAWQLHRSTDGRRRL